MNVNRNSALCCALMALYKEVPAPSRTEPRKEAIKAYASNVGGTDKGLLWCPVLHDWIEEEQFKCTHIVPHRLNRSIVDYIFELGSSGKIGTVSNMLMIDRDVEHHFDKGHLVIIPARPQRPPIMDWMIRVTNDDVRKSRLSDGETRVTLCDLYYRELRFKNSLRSAARFLYFHFVMTLLVNKRDKAGGWEKYLMELPAGKPFATPDAYLWKSLLLALAEQTGDFNGDKTVEVLDEEGHATFKKEKNMSRDEERDVASCTTDCVRQPKEED
ncbi:MAG: hypothetical protein Q9167_007786 [Letrouitia subvulpina]